MRKVMQCIHCGKSIRADRRIIIAVCKKCYLDSIRITPKRKQRVVYALRKTKPKFPCDHCGELTNKKQNNKELGDSLHFCSRLCKIEWAQNNELVHKIRTGIAKPCPDCGKKIARTSAKCRTCQLRTLQTRNKKEVFCCPLCNKRFMRWPSQVNGRTTFCSRSCQSRWNGRKRGTGKTCFTKLLRGSEAYYAWCRKVHEKHKFRCVICGDTKRQIHVHHIKPLSIIKRQFFASYPLLNARGDKSLLLDLALLYKPFWDVANGISICARCHQAEHPERYLWSGD